MSTNTIVINNSTSTNAFVMDALIPPNVPLNLASLTILFKHMTPLDTEPDDPLNGDVYLDDGTNTASGTRGFRRYNGSAWTDIGLQTAGGTFSLGDLNNVTVSAIVDGDRLVYNAARGEWENTGTVVITSTPTSGQYQITDIRLNDSLELYIEYDSVAEE